MHIYVTPPGEGKPTMLLQLQWPHAWGVKVDIDSIALSETKTPPFSFSLSLPPPTLLTDQHVAPHLPVAMFSTMMIMD